MQWENLTSREFTQAVKDTGVCVIAMGVTEKHGDHLPLGTDFLNGHKIACLAAEKEPAVVFPPFYFGQIYEAKCFPGTIAVKPNLLLELTQNIFDEIGRNGFKKIVIYNAHGGNTHFLSFITQCSLSENKPYSIYLQTERIAAEKKNQWNKICESKHILHADEWETSVSLANHSELVKMEYIPKEPVTAMRRMQHLKPTMTGIGWYSDYPEHYSGDANKATEEKGYMLRQIIVDTLADYIAAVKKDQAVPMLEKEFFDRAGKITDAE
jgi:creatinine amidohydrolase